MYSHAGCSCCEPSYCGQNCCQPQGSKEHGSDVKKKFCHGSACKSSSSRYLAPEEDVLHVASPSTWRKYTGTGPGGLCVYSNTPDTVQSTHFEDSQMGVHLTPSPFCTQNDEPKHENTRVHQFDSRPIPPMLNASYLCREEHLPSSQLQAYSPTFNDPDHRGQPSPSMAIASKSFCNTSC